MSPAELVWNAAERRPRTPVRLLAAVAVAAVVALLVGGVAVALGLRVPSLPTQTALLGAMLFEAVLAAVVLAVAALALDRRRVRDYGLGIDRDWAVDFGVGLALGAVLVSLVFAVLLAAGWLTVTGTGHVAGPLSFPLALTAVLAALLAVGVVEEVVVRGFLLTNVAEALRPFGPRGATALAVGFSSATFGALHATNPNATAVSAIGVALAGVMLGLGYVLTGELGLPIGLHIAWNAVLGPVYGLPVSGVDFGVSLLVVRVTGPAALTGGGFGPEAGLVGVGASVLGSVVTAVYARWRYGPPDLDSLVTPDLRWRTASVPTAADGSESTGPDDPGRRT